MKFDVKNEIYVKMPKNQKLYVKKKKSKTLTKKIYKKEEFLDCAVIKQKDKK